MKNTNFKTKLIARVMLIVIVLSSMVITSCEWVSQFYPNQTTTTTENIVHHEPEDLVNGMLAKMKAAGYEEMKAIADMYYQAPYLSASYLLDLEIKNGCIYIYGIIYDDITYVTEYDLVYDDNLVWYTSNYDKEIYETLQMIQNHNSCYIIKPQIQSGYGLEIAVYEINDVYYFLASYDAGEVVRIHTLTIK